MLVKKTPDNFIGMRRGVIAQDAYTRIIQQRLALLPNNRHVILYGKEWREKRLADKEIVLPVPSSQFSDLITHPMKHKGIRTTHD